MPTVQAVGGVGLEHVRRRVFGDVLVNLGVGLLARAASLRSDPKVVEGHTLDRMAGIPLPTRTASVRRRR